MLGYIYITYSCVHALSQEADLQLPRHLGGRHSPLKWSQPAIGMQEITRNNKPKIKIKELAVKKG